MSDILVSISCITYNHAPYIRQCLEGFLMQKTNFRFEILIHDDASTDGNEEIIREYAQKYPHIIKPLYEKENQWSKGRAGSGIFNIPRAQGKYIAFCEGDDYWIDCYKLQKQIDFMESHPECGLICSNALTFNQETKQFGSALYSPVSVSSFKELLCHNTIPTLTVCIKKEAIAEYNQEIKPETQNWLMGDFPLWLWIAHKDEIKFMPETTGVYRILKESASHSASLQKEEAFILNYLSIKDFFIKRYAVEIPDDLYRDNNMLLFRLFNDYLKKHDFKKAKEYYRRIQTRWLTKKQRRKVKQFYLRYFIFLFKRKH